MKYCGKCGAELKEGNAFCMQCGARTTDYNNAAAGANTGNTQQQYQPQGNSVPYNAQPQGAPVNPIPEISLFDGFKKCMKHYADFSGRARRKEFWGFSLFYALFYGVGLIVAAILDIIIEMPVFTVLVSLSSLAFIIPSLAVTVRRLHDIGKSGGWYFISLIPLIGAIWLLVLVCTEGEPRANMYGL
jgi:uncharacterized membrane protein YhaH (DUF805 family)